MSDHSSWYLGVGVHHDHIEAKVASQSLNSSVLRKPDSETLIKWNMQRNTNRIKDGLRGPFSLCFPFCLSAFSSPNLLVLF